MKSLHSVQIWMEALQYTYQTPTTAASSVNVLPILLGLATVLMVCCGTMSLTSVTGLIMLTVAPDQSPNLLCLTHQIMIFKSLLKPSHLQGNWIQENIHNELHWYYLLVYFCLWLTRLWFLNHCWNQVTYREIKFKRTFIRNCIGIIYLFRSV